MSGDVEVLVYKNIDSLPRDVEAIVGKRMRFRRWGWKRRRARSWMERRDEHVVTEGRDKTEGSGGKKMRWYLNRFGNWFGGESDIRKNNVIQLQGPIARYGSDSQVSTTGLSGKSYIHTLISFY